MLFRSNLDFADVKAVMKNAGSALMGIGRASGDNRATIAAQQAIESPLIEVKIDGARGVLFSVAGGYDMAMSEIQEAAEVITRAVSPDANIIFGASIRPELEDEIVVTVVATGFDGGYYRSDEPAEPVKETVATVGDYAAHSMVQSDSNKENSIVMEESKPSDMGSNTAEQPTSNTTAEFTGSDHSNMWDSIRANEPEDDLDVPPSLRDRLRGKS